MFREGLKKMVDSTRVMPTLQVDADPLLSLVKKKFLSLNETVKCFHASEADINVCPYLENSRTMTRKVSLKDLGYSCHTI